MINCIGTLLGTSGYAVHFKSLVNELNKITLCKILTNLQPGFERFVNDQELEMIKKEQDHDVNLIVTHPLHWKTNLTAKRNWVYLISEGDRVPKWIAEECLNPDIEKIIVASTHSLEALMKTMEKMELDMGEHDKVYDKVVLIPHGVDLNIFHPKEFKLGDKIKVDPMNSPKPPFRFLANKGLRNLEDRGGVQYLIKAYIEEFTQEENTQLHVKINPAYGIPDLPKLIPEIVGRRDVIFHTTELSQEQLNEMYNMCDVFVSPTRAEAFNIPCLEALACGKPVMTTNFGGQTDFIKDTKNGTLIDYDLVEVEHEIEFEGVKWATPNHKKLKCALRFSFENPEIYKSMSKCALETAKELTWENTAKQVNSLLTIKLK